MRLEELKVYLSPCSDTKLDTSLLEFFIVENSDFDFD